MRANNYQLFSFCLNKPHNLNPKTHTKHRMTPTAFAFLKAELGVKNLVNVRVDHCPFAFAAVIDAVAGWRLVYSGDTRPCERLVQVSKQRCASRYMKAWPGLTMACLPWPCVM